MSTTISTRDTITLLRSLASAVESGLGVLAFLRDDAATAAMNPLVRAALRGRIEGGDTFSDALEVVRSLDRYERALIAAGERAGQLDRALYGVVELLEERQASRHRLAIGLVYPVVLLVVAGTVLPLPLAFTEGFRSYLLVAVWVPLLLLAAVFFFGVHVPRQAADSMVRRLPLRVGASVPFVREGLRRRAQGIFARVLGRSIGSGIPMSEAISSAAAASGSERLRGMSEAMVRRVEAGGSLADAIGAAGFFDLRFVAMIAQGELAGGLDLACDRLAKEEAAAADGRFRALTIALVGIVLGVVFLAVAVGVVRGFLGYVDALDGVMENI